MPDPQNSVADGAKQARRWKKELMLAEKREREWERESEKIVKRFRGEEKKRNRFNVLWANTEILRPAIYNSRPNPDVRRRFRDSDPVGKAVSEVLERSLQVFVDGDEFDDALTNDVLDGLLPGRGLSRIRYVPKIKTTEAEREANDDEILDSDQQGDDQQHDKSDADRPTGEEDDEAVELPDEEIESETVEIVHVDWKDFRHGYGRVWAEVPWEAFRHKLTREEAEEKFGAEEALDKIEFTVPVGDDYKKPGEQVGETEKLAEFWEIWDKVGKRVFFTHDSVEKLLYPIDNPDGEPPLEFDGFFPNPRPLMIVENTGSLLPTPPFRLYEDQAAQLDEISMRINKIVKGTRLRGVYDAKIPELKDLLSSDDNEMIPIQNAQAWKDTGLDGAVSFFPIDKNAAILEGLYAARDKQKAIIDELTGIADIMRGATDPNETLGAQELKSTYGSVRLQRMQKEVQRYARDLVRLAAAAMSQKFSPETFTAMTELNFPTKQQKQLLQVMFAQRAAQAAQQAAMQPHPMAPGAPPAASGPPHPMMPPGQPPGAVAGGPPMMPPGAQLHTPPPQPMGAGPGIPGGAIQAQPGLPPRPPIPGASPPPGAVPPPIPGIDPGMLNLPTWDDIIGTMRSEKRRQYKIDVETDSTVAGTLSSDMAGLSQVLTAISQAMQELAPMVEQGVLPVDAAKEIILTVIRRARMGMAVEDAFDKLQAPKPKPDPAAAKAQAEAQADVAKAQAKGQSDQQLEQMRQQGETQRMMFEEHSKNLREQMIEQMKSQREENDARFDAMVKIIVATITATKQQDPAVQPVADRTVAGSSALPAAPAPAPQGMQ
jgi:hypothetical protein